MKIPQFSETIFQDKKDWPEDGLESVPHCPVCGDNRETLVYSDLCDRVFHCAPGKWNLYECNVCGTAYLNPRPTPSTIGLAYREYCTHSPIAGIDYAKASPWRRFRIAQRNAYLNANYGYRLKPEVWQPLFLSAARRRRFDSFTGYLHFPGSGAHLLDIGCGNGSFLSQMRALGWEVAGVEPDPQSAAHARAAGLDVRDGLLQQHSWPDNHFDAVTMNHVIEHLHDPVDTLRRSWRLLKPGGLVRVITPNFGSWGRLYYGSDWVPLDPPRHLILFTERSLRQAMERCGFSVSRPTHTSLRGREWFPSCAHFQQGGELPMKPSHLTLVKRISVELQAWRANCATKKNPALTEELVLFGKKPD